MGSFSCRRAIQVKKWSPKMCHKTARGRNGEVESLVSRQTSPSTGRAEWRGTLGRIKNGLRTDYGQITDGAALERRANAVMIVEGRSVRSVDTLNRIRKPSRITCLNVYARSVLKIVSL